MTKSFTFLLLVATAALPSFGSQLYSGSDTACFYTTPSSSCTAVSGTSGTGGSVFPPDPFLTFTTAPAWNNVSGPNILLGTFDVPDSVASGELPGTTTTFVLDVDFTNPNDGTQDYTADVTGFVVLGDGSATITFNPASETFGTGPSAFTFTMDPTTVNVSADDLFHPGDNAVKLYGTVGTTATPEPSSLAPIGGGLMLLGIALYRRRSAATLSN